MHLKSINSIQLSDKKHFILFFFLLIALSTVMMIRYNPLGSGHDLAFHLVRFQVLMDAIKEGTFPYYLDYDAIERYGYFTKAFYSDVILIPFAILGNLTNIVFAYNTMIFTMTVLCGLFTYIAVKTVFKNNNAATISSILYTFCTYRLLDVYQRAALGESLSFTFLPVVYLGLYHIIKGDYKKWYILVIGFSLIIFSHVLASILTFITICLFIIIYNRSLRKEPKRLAYLLLSGFITILITSYYIFPMLEQMISDTFYYQTNAPILPENNRLSISWIFWGLLGGGVQPRQIFVPSVGMLISATICLRLFILKKTELLKHADILVIAGLIYIIAVSTIFPWHLYPFKLFSFIQFPWRLYEFVSFFWAIAGGYYFAVTITTSKRLIISYTIIIILTIFIIANDSSIYKDIRPEYKFPKRELTNKYSLGNLEYLPSSVPSINFIADRKDTIASNNNSKISNFTRNKSVISFDIDLDTGKDITELPLIYYKGYSAYQNNDKLSVTESKNGLIELNIQKSGYIKVFYEGTLVQRVSVYLTLLTSFALVLYILLSRRRKNARRPC